MASEVTSSTVRGLRAAEVTRLLAVHGPNRPPAPRRTSLFAAAVPGVALRVAVSRERRRASVTSRPRRTVKESEDDA